LGLFLHVPLAMVVGTFLGLLLNFAFFGRIVAILGFPNEISDAGFYNPLLWIASLFLGLLINYSTQHRSAYWVAGVGVCYLLAVLFSDVSGYEGSEYYREVSSGHYLRYGFHVLFSLKCKDGQCLKQALVTEPFFNSIAYAFGAWFGLKFVQESNKRAQRRSSAM
jgi:hypothetical protein